MRRSRTVVMLFAPLLLATTLHVGPPLPIANLQPGDPLTWDRVMTTWNDANGLNAVVGRRTPDHFQAVGMTIRDDGTADPAALTPYPILPEASTVAPIGDDLMAVRETSEIDIVVARRIGRDGTPRSAGVRVHYGLGVGQLFCSDSSCYLYSGSGGIFIDGNGNFILQPTSERVDKIVASPFGFLTYDVVTKSAAVRDRQGAVKKLFAVPDDEVTLSWDGARYLVATKEYYGTQLHVTEVAPLAGGATATKTIDVGGLFDQVNLAWNGTQYLLFFETLDGHSMMRLNAALQPIDAAPKSVSGQLAIWYPTLVVGTPDGFRILYEIELTSFLRTTFVRNDGTVVPGVQPVITDRASQQPLAATSGRSAILGVWSEGDDVFAARIGRDGRPLDAAPIEVGRASTPVRVASDGDGFVIVWDKNALLIDAAGRTMRLDLPISDPLQHANLEFVNGAYQLAFFGDCSIGALTITSTGAVSAPESIARDCGTSYYDSVAFDGRHIVALGVNGKHIFSASKDVVTGVVTSHDLIEFAGFAPLIAIARDGDSLLTFYEIRGPSVHYVYVNHLTLDGRFALPHSVLAATPTYVDSIIRIADTWFLAYGGISLTPFSNVTFASGTPITLSDDYRGRLCSGWDGEALLATTRDVAVTSGWAAQMIVRTVGGQPGHGRAAGH